MNKLTPDLRNKLFGAQADKKNIPSCALEFAEKPASCSKPIWVMDQGTRCVLLVKKNQGRKHRRSVSLVI